ncbi:MAG: hypothetical protein RSB14_04670 [Kiritimatiellia bacterium]
MTEPVNIICLKWGTRYPASFTNILYASVKRHLHRPFRFVCFTEDASELNPEIDAQPLPENPCPEIFKMWWPQIFIKLLLFKDGLANLKGPTLFFDVDVVIQEDIDCFFDYKPGENCIIHNWIERRKQIFRKRPAIGNSSCFRFEAGKSGDIYETFMREMKDAVNPALYTTEQAFMTYAMKTVNWWPEAWIKSFKRSCIPFCPLNLLMAPKRPETRVLVFHGNPDPDKAVAGFKGKRLHQNVRPCPWILGDWHE